MAKTASRIKAPAFTVAAPQSRDDAALHIRQIGDLQRELARESAEMNDRIAAITASYQPGIDGLRSRIQALSSGVQIWCEAHRMELLKGEAKSANLITGEVQWRARPPSVSVRGVEAVIDTLKRLGLGRFVRTKEELNKEAILNEPGAVAGVACISIARGIEDFIITPFEQEAQ